MLEVVGGRWSAPINRMIARNRTPNRSLHESASPSLFTPLRQKTTMIASVLLRTDYYVSGEEENKPGRWH